MLASINVGRVRSPDDQDYLDGLSQYYHLITTRLCQGHASHEHGAARFVLLDALIKKCLLRK